MTTMHDDAPAILHRIGRHGAVTIRLASAELRLTGTDGEDVAVRTTSGHPLPDRVVVETTDAGLTIRERESFGLSFGVGRKTVQLEIDVPVEADVTIDTASGSVEAVGLRGEQRYRTASGDMQLHDMAGRIELNSVSGDVEMELAGPADLVVRSVSGDVAVGGGELRSLRVGTTSGDVRIDSPITGRSGNQIDTLSGDVSLVADAGMRVEARTVSGDMTSDLPHRSEGRMGRRTLVVGDGSIELGFRSVSGDLQIHAARPRPDRVPTAPTAPTPPTPPVAPIPPTPPTPFGSTGDTAGSTGDAADAADATEGDDASEMDRMAVLRALEAGELDVATAMDRLAALDGHEEQTGV